MEGKKKRVTPLMMVGERERESSPPLFFSSFLFFENQNSNQASRVRSRKSSADRRLSQAGDSAAAAATLQRRSLAHSRYPCHAFFLRCTRPHSISSCYTTSPPPGIQALLVIYLFWFGCVGRGESAFPPNQFQK